MPEKARTPVLSRRVLTEKNCGVGRNYVFKDFNNGEEKKNDFI